MERAPAEIINEIFKYLINKILVVHNPREFPWYLGQICASWRAEFVSTPWIWRTFIIHVQQIRERDLDNAASLVKLCIQRSWNQPLSFTLFYVHGSPPSKRRQYANLMLSDLIAESQRWEVVDVGREHLFSLKAFCLPNLSNHLPLLRSMALLTTTMQTNRVLCDKPKFWELFLRADSLTRVDIACFPAYCDFDWSRLTVLTLHYLRAIADVLPVIRRLRCIEKLQLGEIFGKADEEQDAMITLPTLKVLSCPGIVLRHLRAPALEELRMDRRPRALGVFLPDGVISSLRTSSGSLTRLILGKGCCIDSDAKRILQELPNVTRLCLEARLDLSDVLPYNLEERIQILPKLELLIVRRYLRLWDSQDTIKTLYATVASRTSKRNLFEWPYRAEKLKELRMINYEYRETSRLRRLCKERKVKYLASESFQKAGHIWCFERESCAFDLCNSNSLFMSETESLISH